MNHFFVLFSIFSESSPKGRGQFRPSVRKLGCVTLSNSCMAISYLRGKTESSSSGHLRDCTKPKKKKVPFAVAAVAAASAAACRCCFLLLGRLVFIVVTVADACYLLC